MARQPRPRQQSVGHAAVTEVRRTALQVIVALVILAFFVVVIAPVVASLMVAILKAMFAHATALPTP